jgi:hypothetical protein
MKVPLEIAPPAKAVTVRLLASGDGNNPDNTNRGRSLFVEQVSKTRN